MVLLFDFTIKLPYTPNQGIEREMNKLSKVVKFVNLTDKNYAPRDVTPTDDEKFRREISTMTDEELLKRVKQMLFYLYRFLTDEDLDSLINICTNPRIGSIIRRLIFAVAYPHKKDVKPPSYMEEVPEDIFDRDWEQIMRG